MDILESLDLLECEFGVGKCFLEFSISAFGVVVRLSVFHSNDLSQVEFTIPNRGSYIDKYDLKLDKAIKEIQEYME